MAKINKQKGKDEPHNEKTKKKLAERYYEAVKRQDHEHQLRQHDESQTTRRDKDEERRKQLKKSAYEELIVKGHDYSDRFDHFKQRIEIKRAQLAERKITHNEYLTFLQEAEIIYKNSAYYYNHWSEGSVEDERGNQHLMIFEFLEKDIPVERRLWKVVSNLEEEELRILASIKKGKTYKEIAQVIPLEIRTLARKVSELKRKSGCKEIEELIEYAIDYGFIE